MMRAARHQMSAKVRTYKVVVGLAIAFLLLAPHPTWAQEPTLRFERLTLDEGLSSNYVDTILQDSAGFVWFGTSDGLNKYDGSTFTIYHFSPDDPTSLSNNAVTTLYEDSTRTLWVGTRRGLNRLDRATGRFVRYLHDPHDPHSLSHDRIGSILEDANGTLWVGTRAGGVNRFDRATQTFTAYTIRPDAVGGALYKDRANQLWVGNTAGLHRLDPATGTFTPVRFDPATPDHTIFAMCEDHTGIFWLTTEQGLFAYDPRTGTATHYQHDPTNPRSLSAEPIYALHEDRSGTLWLGTYGAGINSFDRTQHNFHHYVNDPSNPTSLSDNAILAIYEDRAGLLWFGTQAGGVGRFNPATRDFAHYTFDPTQPQSLPSRSVSAIYADQDGGVWVGIADKGVTRLDRSLQVTKVYRHDDADARTISSNQIQFIYEDRAGILWMGTGDAGLNRFDRATDSFLTYRHHPRDPTSLSNDVVTQIFEDSTGTLWIGTEDGLNILDRATGRFTVYRSTPTDPASLSSSDISALAEDQHGTLWVGTWGGGLNAFDRTTNTFRSYQYDPSRAESLSDNFVSGVIGDSQGLVWIGTNTGLNKLDPRTSSFIHYTKRDQLPSNNILCLQLANDGQLWLSAGRGLTWFDPIHATVRSYTARDGLQDNAFVGTCSRSRDGRLFFAGINGFNAFDPRVIEQRSTPPPPVVLTAIRTLDGPVTSGPDITTLTDLSLSYRDTMFSIDFAALDFADTSRNQYAYMLEGFDRAWIQAGSQHTATYTNLDGGSYVFRVRAANSAGVWNETGLALTIHIDPPPWKTWWAYSLYVLVLIGSVGSFIQYRARTYIRKLNQRDRLAADLEELVAQRTEERDQFFTLSEDLFCIAGTDGYFKRLNAAWQTTLGFTPDELLAEPYLGFVHPEDRAATLLALQYGTQGNRLVSFENRYRRKNDTYTWLSWGVTLLPERQVYYAVARDVSEQKRAEQEQQRLYQVAHGLRDVLVVLNSNRPLAETLHFIVGQATRLLGVTAGLLDHLHSDAGGSENVLGIEASQGFFANYVGACLKHAPLTVSYQAIQSRRPMALSDMAETLDQLLAQATFGLGEQQLITEIRQRFRSILVVPLMINDDVYGTISLYDTQQRGFTDDEITLATAFATQSALAIANAHLREQVEQTAVVDERNRLARDLHDSVTQALYSLTLLAEGCRFQAAEQRQLQAAQDFERFGEIAHQALKEMRALIYQLRVPMLEEEGLTDALQRRLRVVERHTGVKTRLIVEGEIALASRAEEQLYRIIQEAINNALKHAKADNVTVHIQSVRQNGDEVMIEVCDNGVGFDAATTPRGIGFGSMCERAAQLGGIVIIHSVPGHGTTVRVVVPAR